MFIAYKFCDFCEYFCEMESCIVQQQQIIILWNYIYAIFFTDFIATISFQLSPLENASLTLTLCYTINTLFCGKCLLQIPWDSVLICVWKWHEALLNFHTHHKLVILRGKIFVILTISSSFTKIKPTTCCSVCTCSVTHAHQNVLKF